MCTQNNKFINNKNYAIMEAFIKQTLNEKVFVEFYIEKDVNEKTWYCITAYFRYTHRCHTVKYENYSKAEQTYKDMIQ